MTPTQTPRRIPAFVLGLTVAGFAALAGSIAMSHADNDPVLTPASNGPVRCEVAFDERRGSTTIEARVTTDRAVRGTYSLAIRSASSGGRAMISQSGEFEARAGATEVLGSTTLSGARATFTADFELRVDGQRLTCSDARDL